VDVHPKPAMSLFWYSIRDVDVISVMDVIGNRCIFADGNGGGEKLREIVCGNFLAMREASAMKL
jgi:hypothetical protein